MPRMARGETAGGIYHIINRGNMNKQIKGSGEPYVGSIKEKKLDSKKLEKSLIKAKSIEERNSIIFQANREGFSQHKLALMAGVSQTQINRIIKKKSVGFT